MIRTLEVCVDSLASARAAIAAGAKTVTVCDTAGAMLPNEFTAFIRELYAAVPELKDVVLGVACSDQLSMADSCAIAAVRYGAGEIKAAAFSRSKFRMLIFDDSKYNAHGIYKVADLSAFDTIVSNALPKNEADAVGVKIFTKIK